MHLVEGSDDPMQILKDLTAQRQRVLGRRGVFGYEARSKSKEVQTGMCRVSVRGSVSRLEVENSPPWGLCPQFLVLLDLDLWFWNSFRFLTLRFLPDPIPDPEPIIIGNPHFIASYIWRFVCLNIFLETF